MTIYIVTRGEYSDYSIVAVFDNKVAADNYAHNTRDDYDRARVEEYEMNSECEKLGIMWGGEMMRDGEVRYIGQRAAIGNEELSLVRMRNSSPVLVFARRVATKEHAVKIANDKRVQLIASGEWADRLGGVE